MKSERDGSITLDEYRRFSFASLRQFDIIEKVDLDLGHNTFLHVYIHSPFRSCT